MKTFSVIVPFRNRFEHLEIFAPRIKKHFSKLNVDMQLVVVEQPENDGGFRRGGLLNAGAKFASDSDMFVLHDVDYLPTEEVEYYDGASDVFLPVKYVEFIRPDFSLCSIEDVSKGYQHFSKRFGGNGVDDNFWGAVTTIKKEIFFKTSFDNAQKWWGAEDCVLRERCLSKGINVNRSKNNTFDVLNHNNHAPTPDDARLQFNIFRANNWPNFVNNNVNTMVAKIEKIPTKHKDVDIWLQATEFDGPTHVITSNYNFDD
jgi:hypothetical protein